MDTALAVDAKSTPATYDAFVSYATDPDRNLVRDVEKFVEGLHRDRLLPEEFRAPLALCVDGHDFPVPEVDSGSQVSLKELMRKVVLAYQETSRCLLVFSGSETIDHPWINDEIDWWRQRANSGPIYFVLTHGQLNVDAKGDVLLEGVHPRALANKNGMSPFWFDLRGYYRKAAWHRPLQSAFERKARRESSAWIKVRDYDEERFRLAAHILSLKYAKTVSPEDLIPNSMAAFRFKRRVQRTLIGGGVAAVLAMAGLVDRTLEAREIDAKIQAAQAATGDQRYEEAIKIAIGGLPVDGGSFWHYGWSDPNIRRLLVTLAGAAQLSAYGGQLKTDEGKPIQTAAFSPNGAEILTASQAGTVTVWDSRTGTKKATCSQVDAFRGYQRNQYNGANDWVRDSRFGGSGEMVLSVGGYGAWIWNTNCSSCASGDDKDRCPPIVRMIGHAKDARTGSFSPNRKMVITTSDDGTARIWDARDGTEQGRLQLPSSRLPEDYSYTTDAEFSRDGESIVVSRRDGLIAIVDSKSRETKKVLQPSGSAAVWSAQFDREGKRVLSTSANGEIAIWDLSSDRRIVFPLQTSGVGKASFSPDERLVVTTSLDGTARIWDTTSITPIFALKGHARPVISAQFSQDGKQIITSSDDQTARIWNIGTAIVPDRVQASLFPIECSAMSADGRKLVVGTLDGRVILYELKDQSVLQFIDELNPNIGSITSVSLGFDSKTIVLSSERGSVMLWSRDSGTARLLTTLPAGRSIVATEKKGNLIVSASLVDEEQSHNGVIDLQTGKWSPLAGLHSITSLEFNLSGTQIAAKSDASSDGKWSAYVWDTATRKVTSNLKHDSPVLSAHFGENGLHLATSSLDYKARVWELATGQVTHIFNGHTYDVNSARLSPDGTRLVTASSDRTVRVWDVRTEATILQFSPGREANDAFFTKDGSHIVVTTAAGEILTYDVSWSSNIDKSLKDRVCREKLPPNGKDQCFRVGPFAIEFWRRWFSKHTAGVSDFL